MADQDIPIKYTSRTFNDIKSDLVEHTKRYYPDQYKDFSKASFGSLMFDAVAYVGDVLSFYLDYQANESFLDTATEYQNIVRLAKQLGYNYKPTATATGTVSFYVLVPANANGIGVDSDYLPLLKRGAIVTSTGGNPYTLIDDVDFTRADAEVVVATTNATTGVPTHYAIKIDAEVISGTRRVHTANIGGFRKFRSVTIPDPFLTEILSVADSNGNIYYEVPSLAQNVIYRNVKNRGSDSNRVPYILTPHIVTRRFSTAYNRSSTTLQFGHGSDLDVTNNAVADPSAVVLKRHAKDYTTAMSLDPGKLVANDKFGVGPSNTTLYISYRANTSNDVNAGVGTLVQMGGYEMQFSDEASLVSSKVSDVRTSLQVDNERRIVGDIDTPNTTELKLLAKNYFAAQNRAVTTQDYISMIYSMPPKFGAVKRCSIAQDKDSFKRNLNIYVVSEYNGNLVQSTPTVKNNLKVWINDYKMLNDTIDILDANVINIGVRFSVIAQRNVNSIDLMLDLKRRVAQLFNTKMNVGEALSIAQIYRTLNSTDGVVDTLDVTIFQKTGTGYSDIFFDVEANTSYDGQMLLVPDSFVLELKDTQEDIIGVIK